MNRVVGKKASRRNSNEKEGNSGNNNTTSSTRGLFRSVRNKLSSASPSSSSLSSSSSPNIPSETTPNSSNSKKNAATTTTHVPRHPRPSLFRRHPNSNSKVNNKSSSKRINSRQQQQQSVQRKGAKHNNKVNSNNSDIHSQTSSIQSPTTTINPNAATTGVHNASSSVTSTPSSHSGSSLFRGMLLEEEEDDEDNEKEHAMDAQNAAVDVSEVDESQAAEEEGQVIEEVALEPANTTPEKASPSTMGDPPDNNDENEDEDEDMFWSPLKQSSASFSTAIAAPSYDEEEENDNDDLMNQKSNDDNEITTSTQLLSLPKHDDYTDYSCSTSIERLARDLATHLQAWNVNEGCDRHASFPRRGVDTGQHERLVSSSAGRHVQGLLQTPVRSNKQTTNTDATTETKGGQGQNDNIVQDPTMLLRSATFPWALSFYLDNGKQFSATIELELCLWDVPLNTDENSVDDDEDKDDASSPPRTNNNPYQLPTALQATNNAKMSLPDQQQRKRAAATTAATSPETAHLPFSLQRKPLQAMLNNNRRSHSGAHHPRSLENFSTLFGIGQHMTLTPAQSPQDLFQQQPEWLQLWDEYLVTSVTRRHDRLQTASSAVSHCLTHWLQTALNLAILQTNCHIPVFGWWGVYQPDCGPSFSHLGKNERDNGKTNERGKTSAVDQKGLPSWLQSSHAVSALPPSRTTARSRLRLFPPSTPRRPSLDNTNTAAAKTMRNDPPPQDCLNVQHLSPIISGLCWAMGGDNSDDNSDLRASFWLGLLQHRAPSAARARLAAWGDLLLRYCCDQDDKAHLWQARHVFGWRKPNYRSRIGNGDQEDDGLGGPSPAASPAHPGMLASPSMRDVWRQPSKLNSGISPSTARTAAYNKRVAKALYAPAFRQDSLQHILRVVSKAAGASADDPLWGPADDPVQRLSTSLMWAAAADKVQAQPLLQLPLKIRSSQAMSEEDWIEAEEAIESSVLNPVRAMHFSLTIEWDPKVVQTPLAAMQHCILAALIRTSTLPSETLLNHLTDAAVLERWDTAAGNVIARNLGERARVGTTTTALVEAMDWDYAVEDMIEPWQALEIVRNVLDDSTREILQIPSPPEDNLSDLLDAAQTDVLFLPLPRAAPFGRLFSVLCAYISRVRSPSSMVQVFGTFVQELRRRWDFRESLPNLRYLPGVDAQPSTETARSRIETLGIQAPQSAYLHSNYGEPEPDEYHCLIGQKLQVFNLCLETVIGEELREAERLERQLAGTAHGGDISVATSDFASLPPIVEASPPRHTTRRGGHKNSSSDGVTGNASSDDDDRFDEGGGGNEEDNHSILTFDTSSMHPAAAAKKKKKLPSRNRSFSSQNARNSSADAGLDDSKSAVTFDTKSIVYSGDHTVRSVATKKSVASRSTHFTDAQQEHDENGGEETSRSNNKSTDDDSNILPPPAFSKDALSVASSSRFTDARSVMSSQSTIFTDAEQSQQFSNDGQSTVFTAAKSEVTMHFGPPSVATSARQQQDDTEDTEDQKSVATKSTSQSRYFDANRSFATSTVRSAYYDAEDGGDGENGGSNRRRGARCPVQGLLMANGDQIFAPYLQRPLPLTDDLVAQRRQLLESHRGSATAAAPSSSKEETDDWLERLDVAHMIQRPKLLSDMSSFKAANPNASLTDFVSWYGEPVNPLADDDQEEESRPSNKNWFQRRGSNSSNTKSTRSAQLLERTRAFWSKNWDVAQPVPAAEQEPLFNASNTVEMHSLDYLETLHPASLICNVMATNLSNAFFSLIISAGDATKLPIVQGSLARLRNTIEIALKLLSDDTLSQRRNQQPQHAAATEFSYASLETLAACERACHSIGENEILLSNALSLLHKFPRQANLVEQLLQRGSSKNTNMDVENGPERLGVLEGIVAAEQRNRHPILREYLFRNRDETHPCQLRVRCGDDKEEAAQFGGLLVALTRTESSID